MSVQNEILLVDDDKNIREMVSFAVEKAGFKVTMAKNQMEALQITGQREFEMILLDINLPDGNGLDICKSLRTKSQVPIIFLTCNDEEIDKVVAFEIGGDDYVTKPFSPRELVARMKAIRRRANTQADKSQAENLSIGKLTLSLDSCTAEIAGTKVVLTATEFEILRALLNYPNKVYSRSELLERVYKETLNVGERTIDTHIRRIRKKFEGLGWDVILTVPGFGYQVGPCDKSI